jgi:hypothetical protein
MHTKHRKSTRKRQRLEHVMTYKEGRNVIPKMLNHFLHRAGQKFGQDLSDNKESDKISECVSDKPKYAWA